MATFINIHARLLVVVQTKAWIAVAVETALCVDAALLAGMLAGYTFVDVITCVGDWIVSESRGTQTFVRPWSVFTLT